MRYRQYQSPLTITSRYRDQCAILSKRFRSFYVGRATSFTWEAFGLGSDLRNANQPTKIIEGRTGYTIATFQEHWPKFFPELIDNHLPSPLHEGIIKSLNKGISQKTIASRYNTTKGVISGIAYRLRKKKVPPCKTPTHPRNLASDPAQSPSATPAHTMSIANSNQTKRSSLR